MSPPRWSPPDTPTTSATLCHWLPTPSIAAMPASGCNCWWSLRSKGQGLRVRGQGIVWERVNYNLLNARQLGDIELIAGKFLRQSRQKNARGGLVFVTQRRHRKQQPRKGRKVAAFVGREAQAL